MKINPVNSFKIDSKITKINKKLNHKITLEETFDNIERERLLIDLDGVVANFDKAIKDLDPTLCTKNGEGYATRSIKVHNLCKRHPRIFLNLEPIEGAIESVKELMEYYDVYFCSTPMYDVPESYMDKRLWLEKHFGELAEKRLILTHRKDMVIGDYLIDDTFNNGAGDFTGEHIHFGEDGEYKTWDDVFTKMINILAFN